MRTHCYIRFTFVFMAMVLGVSGVPAHVESATTYLYPPEPQFGANLGDAAAAIGDVNGDGVDDALVGAPRQDVGGLGAAGKAYVFSGATGDTLYSLVSPNAQTSGYFGDAVAGLERLEIFDVRGRSVRTLLDREMTAGTHAAHWDGRDDGGNRLSSGVYFYRLTTPAGTKTRKMQLVR